MESASLGIQGPARHGGPRHHEDHASHEDHHGPPEANLSLIHI